LARPLDRDIWAMAWPVLLSYMLTNAVDLVDIAMVGRLGSDSVAAVGYAAQYVHLLRTLLLSVGIACVALTARALGAAQPERALAALSGALLVAVGIALTGCAIVWSVPGALLDVLNATPHVTELALPYFRLSATATLLLAGSLTLESAHRAQRNMRTPLIIASAGATVKIALNALLIFGLFGLPRLELVGAGLSTLAAESVALALYIAAGRLGEREGRPLLPTRSSLTRAFGTVGSVLRVALPAVAERFVLNLALLAYFAILSRYGTTAIAAYAIGVRLLAFSWMPGLGFGTAAATLVGQALGSGDREGARDAGWRSMKLALSVMAALGLVCFALREPLARLFTHDAAIIEQLLPFLQMLAIAQPFMGVHFTLSGALRGAGDTQTPLMGAAVGNWLLRVPLAWTAAEMLGLPVIWVWAALVLDHVARSVWYVLAFRGKRWAERVGA
jgi:putative MATE family efflux protein